MSGSRIKFSYEGIGEMLRSPFMADHMGARADRMMAYAVAIAPVSTARSDPHRGRYKASFSTSVKTKDGGIKGDRASGILTNDAPEAPYVEFGTSRQAGQHILRRAMTEGAND